jgi:2-polyprenyl-3-methyl-5-hydroxy-6-metoxy-1,4-benzoquinol methylase
LLEQNTIEEMYDEGYFRERRQYFFNDSDPIKSKNKEESAERNFHSGLSLIGQFAPGVKLLDVGCAVGAFLSLAKTAGWDTSGVDISEYAVSYCRNTLGHDVHWGELKNVCFPREEFDVVTMWDVIEHLNDPVAELKEVHRILKMDGVVLVDTPNEDSLLRSLARIIYVATGGFVKYPIRKLYHEFHLYYFNQDTLRAAFTKSGFEIVHMASRPIPIAKGRARVLERFLVNTVAIPERLLGRGYELVVVARKSRHVG